MSRAREAQAERIVAALEVWLSVSHSERSVTLRETSEGWEATLTENRRAHGATALDCLAQIAVVASVETGG